MVSSFGFRSSFEGVCLLLRSTRQLGRGLALPVETLATCHHDVFKSLRIPIDTSYCKFTEPPKIFSTLVARDLTNGIIRTSGLNAHSKVTVLRS
mmetsp:Transcript_45628/g.98835  ORF Transcript_45628/g.98835 Transcript_45628/m.98835 type:complete len:94 (+) Transcript_45628:577-858(+)